MGIQTERRDPPKATSADLAPLRVLIVDDEASTRMFMRAVLEHCDQFDVVGDANDGGMAITKASALQPDLVLLDISMPTIGGAGALRGIRRVAPDTAVIIVSGAVPAVGQPLLDAGATAFVPKGIAPVELLSRLGSIMDRRFSIDSLDSLIPLDDVDGSSGLGRPPPSNPAPRAVVFAQDPLVRHMIGKVVELCNVSVLAETEMAVTLRAVVEASRPEVVVVELPAGGSMDASVLSEVHRASPDTALVAYAEDEEWREGALASGATAFVLKPRVDELVDQIHSLTSREFGS
jgi:DNA-binding NarL/FixJ family response regulator